MKSKMVKGGLTMLMALFLASVLTGAAAAIEVRPVAGELQIIFEPLKPVYAVGEPIQFKVRGNRDFYLYLFNIDAKRNVGFLLLPNGLQEENRYEANQDYVIPGGKFEMVGDQSGTEKIIMVASTEKLELNVAGLNKSGAFFTGMAAEIEGKAKALQVRPPKPKEEKVHKELTLVITAK
ncbi:MAG: DUF4384 domain-containing protein [Thermodesulfobacteriota bacterium]